MPTTEGQLLTVTLVTLFTKAGAIHRIHPLTDLFLF